MIVFADIYVKKCLKVCQGNFKAMSRNIQTETFKLKKYSCGLIRMNMRQDDYDDNDSCHEDDDHRSDENH